MAPNVEPRPSSRPQKLQQPSPWRRERTGDGFEVLHRHLLSRAGAAVPLLSATRARPPPLSLNPKQSCFSLSSRMTAVLCALQQHI